MKTFKSFNLIIFVVMVLILALLLSGGLVMAQGGGQGGGGGRPDDKGPPNGETAGNNLSFPVIWAEGVTKVLPGTYGVVQTGGAWWYSWGTAGSDPNVVPMSCEPDPDDEAFCNDGAEGTVGPAPGFTDGFPAPINEMALAKAFLQKDPLNSWQAGSADWSAAPVNVDWIDWGDNLESVDWYTRSQVRTEVVLFQDLPSPMTAYAMRHTSGWGISEVHGLAASLEDPPVVTPLDGTQATVFSPCARFTIQLLLVERNEGQLADLVWVPEAGWTEPEGYEDDLINPPIFNKVVYEAGDGPGYYNAEINVKGRIIYGYTWSVSKLHDPTLNNKGAGDYRLTFSFDQSCGGATLNTFFVENVTDIIQPAEEVAEEEPGGGAVGVLVPAEYDEEGNLIGGNLTYMDVRILERGGGGGGGGGNGGGKGGG